jgi:hypothetical protein
LKNDRKKTKFGCIAIRDFKQNSNNPKVIFKNKKREIVLNSQIKDMETLLFMSKESFFNMIHKDISIMTFLDSYLRLLFIF